MPHFLPFVYVFYLQDLVKLCVEYMCEHIAHAAANNQLISWLQYTLTCGHYQVAQVWQFGFQPALCWKHFATTLSNLLSCYGLVVVVFLTSHLVYIGAIANRMPIFSCTKVLLFLFLTEINLCATCAFLGFYRV